MKFRFKDRVRVVDHEFYNGVTGSVVGFRPTGTRLRDSDGFTFEYLLTPDAYSEYPTWLPEQHLELEEMKHVQ